MCVLEMVPFGKIQLPYLGWTKGSGICPGNPWRDSPGLHLGQTTSATYFMSHSGRRFAVILFTPCNHRFRFPVCLLMNGLTYGELSSYRWDWFLIGSKSHLFVWVKGSPFLLRNPLFFFFCSCPLNLLKWVFYWYNRKQRVFSSLDNLAAYRCSSSCSISQMISFSFHVSALECPRILMIANWP